MSQPPDAARPRRRRYAPRLCALLLACAPLLLPAMARAQDPCGAPNVLPANSCNFENWSGDPPRSLPEGWTPFVLSGDIEYARDDHSYFGGGTLRMRNSGSAFKGGIYTSVPVTPGAGYKASVWWGAPNAPDLFGRQLGLDPTGGTDPNSPNIIWGPMHFGDGRMLNYNPGEGPNIDVRARPDGDRMTVFFLVDHPSSSGDNFIYIDVITLVPDESAPARVAPTATPEPPTATPEPPPVVEVAAAAAVAAAPAAAAPTDTPSPSPTPQPTSTPTATPSPTPTVTPTPTLTPTPSPTWTPWPTALPISFIDRAGGALEGGLATPVGEEGVNMVTVSLLALSAMSAAGMLLFGGSLLRLRRRRRNNF